MTNRYEKQMESAIASAESNFYKMQTSYKDGVTTNGERSQMRALIQQYGNIYKAYAEITAVKSNLFRSDVDKKYIDPLIENENLGITFIKMFL